MTERERIGRELAATPEDPTLRQIYADALIEEGGDHALRGELIQRQVAGRFDAETHDLAERVQRAREAGGLSGLGSHEGLARMWVCSIDQLASHAAVAFAAEPLLRRLVVCLPGGEPPRIDVLAAIPELARVRELCLSVAERHVAPGVDGLATLLRSPHWPRLEVLQLSSCNLGDAGAALLAESGSLSELQGLELAYNSIGTAGVVALAGSASLSHLRRLHLTGNRFTGEAIAALAADSNRMRLETLSLDDTGMLAEHVEPIVRRFPGIHIRFDYPAPPPAPPPPPPAEPEPDEDPDAFFKGPFV